MRWPRKTKRYIFESDTIQIDPDTYQYRHRHLPVAEKPKFPLFIEKSAELFYLLINVSGHETFYFYLTTWHWKKWFILFDFVYAIDLHIWYQITMFDVSLLSAKYHFSSSYTSEIRKRKLKWNSIDLWQPRECDTPILFAILASTEAFVDDYYYYYMFLVIEMEWN